MPAQPQPNAPEEEAENESAESANDNATTPTPANDNASPAEAPVLANDNVTPESTVSGDATPANDNDSSPEEASDESASSAADTSNDAGLKKIYHDHYVPEWNKQKSAYDREQAAPVEHKQSTTRSGDTTRITATTGAEAPSEQAEGGESTDEKPSTASDAKQNNVEITNVQSAGDDATAKKSGPQSITVEATAQFAEKGFPPLLSEKEWMSLAKQNKAPGQDGAPLPALAPPPPPPEMPPEGAVPEEPPAPKEEEKPEAEAPAPAQEEAEGEKQKKPKPQGEGKPGEKEGWEGEGEPGQEADEGEEPGEEGTPEGSPEGEQAPEEGPPGSQAKKPGSRRGKKSAPRKPGEAPEKGGEEPGDEAEENPEEGAEEGTPEEDPEEQGEPQEPTAPGAPRPGTPPTVGPGESDKVESDLAKDKALKKGPGEQAGNEDEEAPPEEEGVGGVKQAINDTVAPIMRLKNRTKIKDVEKDITAIDKTIAVTNKKLEAVDKDLTALKWKRRVTRRQDAWNAVKLLWEFTGALVETIIVPLINIVISIFLFFFGVNGKKSKALEGEVKAKEDDAAKIYKDLRGEFKTRQDLFKKKNQLEDAFKKLPPPPKDEPAQG